MIVLAAEEHWEALRSSSLRQTIHVELVQTLLAQRAQQLVASHAEKRVI